MGAFLCAITITSYDLRKSENVNKIADNPEATINNKARGSGILFLKFDVQSSIFRHRWSH
jgi:hypothetical protein